MKRFVSKIFRLRNGVLYARTVKLVIAEINLYLCQSFLAYNFVVVVVVVVVVYLFTHRAPKSSQGTRSKVTVRSGSIWNLEMLVFLWREENRNPGP